MGMGWILTDLSLRIERGITPKVSPRTPTDRPYVSKVTRGATEDVHIAFEFFLIAKQCSIKRVGGGRLTDLVLDVDRDALVRLEISKRGVYMLRIKKMAHNEFCNPPVRPVAVFGDREMVLQKGSLPRLGLPYKVLGHLEVGIRRAVVRRRLVVEVSLA